MKLILLLLVVKLLSVELECAQTTRGVAPEKASLYDETKAFTCLDGSSEIPFSQVNDDYCDCRDGSDEPGTAACLNGQFACENIGYIVQMIPSSRVNDGICDCCDGSDETSSKCENKCIALASLMREEEERIRLLRDQGFTKRQQLIEEGTQLRKALQDKINELEGMRTTAEAEKQRLETLKKEAEEKAREAKEKQDKIFEEKAKELEKIEIQRTAKVLFDTLDLNKDSFISAEELLTHGELDILFDNDGQFTLEESIRLIDQNEKVDFDSFYSTYYEKISPHLNKDTPAADNSIVNSDENKEATAGAVTKNNEEQNENDEVHSEHEENEHEDQEEEQSESEVETVTNRPSDNKYDEQTQNLINESDKAKQSFDEAQRNFNDIEKEISELQKKLNYDVGQNAEFASLVDKCFEYEDREYIYKLCPYEKTVQKSKAGHGETCIGYWSSWGEQPKKYLLMKFANGLGCWNGPQRSTNVYLTCGTENKVISVSEPNRCEYEMKFETPAVCELNGTTTMSEEALDPHEEL